MIEYLYNLYYIVTVINFIVCLSIYVSYELWFDWYRNRQDFWFILLLMVCLTFIPVLNLISLVLVLYFIIFVFIREPIMKLFGFKYDYQKKE